MTRLSAILILMLVLLLTQLEAASPSGKEPNYVQEACSVTRYQDICIESLASFSKIAKRNPGIWARAGVSVTLSKAKNVTDYLIELRNSRSMRGRNRLALMDCIECFQDSLDSLHKSLDILRNLNARPFDVEMSDLTTWLSAVLTYEDTCLDGFDESGRGKRAKLVRDHVKNVTYITSNALALINKLATTGLQSLTHP